MWDIYCLPVMTPALRKKIAKFGAVPLMIKPMTEITEPRQITFRQGTVNVLIMEGSHCGGVNMSLLLGCP